jgi:hypothetical protein
MRFINECEYQSGHQSIIETLPECKIGTINAHNLMVSGSGFRAEGLTEYM